MTLFLLLNPKQFSVAVAEEEAGGHFVGLPLSVPRRRWGKKALAPEVRKAIEVALSEEPSKQDYASPREVEGKISQVRYALEASVARQLELQSIQDRISEIDGLRSKILASRRQKEEEDMRRLHQIYLEWVRISEAITRDEEDAILILLLAS